MVLGGGRKGGEFTGYLVMNGHGDLNCLWRHAFPSGRGEIDVFAMGKEEFRKDFRKLVSEATKGRHIKALNA